MSCLYITENGSKVAVKGGHFIVECQDGSERLVPKETLESIVIFGNVYLTVLVLCQDLVQVKMRNFSPF